MDEHEDLDAKYKEISDFATAKITANIRRRLALDGIDEDTRAIAGRFLTVFDAESPNLIASFYRHVLQHPETRHFFDSKNVNHLKARQIEHWRRMLSCTFDDEYVRSAVMVGLVHHRIGLPLYLYLSGCNRILCDLTSLAIMHHSGALESSQVVSSIIKIVSLDMDITISCYSVADHLRLPADGPMARHTT